MRVLFITDKIPYPPDTGDRLRIYHLMRRVAARHEVWLAALSESPVDAASVAHFREFCAGVTVAVQGHRNPLLHFPGLAAFAVRRRPLELKFSHSPELAARIRALSSAVPFDVVQIEHSYMALYAEELAHQPGTKRILDFHNVEMRQNDRIARIERHAASKARVWLHSRMMQRWEPRYAERFDRCVTCSAADRDMLQSANRRLRVAVVPNGVDTRANQPLPPEQGSRALLFVGTMNYAPSVDAMQYFCRDVLPLIRQRAGDVEMWIVGKDPPQEVVQLAGDGVHVTGRVEDVTPYYRRAAACVVPLRAGGGTRLKILEAMALGRPVVTTTIGCEGLDVTGGQDVVIADDPSQMADQVAGLLQDPGLAGCLTANARRLVTERYDWDVVAGQLMQVYAELSGDGRNGMGGQSRV